MSKGMKLQPTLLALAATILMFDCLSEPSPEPSPEPLPKSKQKPELRLNVPSPQWQDQVVYFLMTDRFNDGDPTNNDQGLGEYNPKLGSHYSGGDIQGVIEQLDYIQNIGATAVWMTPVVANQWWSKQANYGGYHGYWATDFSQVDAHLGNLQTYQQLSDNLHRRNMYLIQDIVVNHTGNFFNYQGGQAGYNPADSAENFKFLEAENSAQFAPTQVPFNMIDRNNPAHVIADIYNWTPTITDYKNVAHQYTYQLGNLADINTKNPQVIDTFKQVYGDWINNVGVDAFRIDTVRYVDHEFFNHFLHDDDGILATAKHSGRNDFLVFGEVFDSSKPYENDAEVRVASYLGSNDKPELNSVIAFPLHHELKTVFAQGMPTEHLAYRIEQHMQMFPNPYILPTFIDNHDMARFLAGGNAAGFKQALATIFTIPGIPVIYQGSGQMLTESRQAMFKGGFKANKDYFDQTSELYKFIQQLAKLRTSDKLFTRGELNMIASNPNGPGVLAYTRSYQNRTVLIMFNSSQQNILISNMPIADRQGDLKPLSGFGQAMSLDTQGNLTTELAGQSIVIVELLPANSDQQGAPKLPIITSQIGQKIVTNDINIEGFSPITNKPIALVKNGRLDGAEMVNTDDKGHWHYVYTVKNLGTEKVSLVAYQKDLNVVSKPIEFVTQAENAKFQFTFTDQAYDDKGLSGSYFAPQHEQSIGQQDLLAANVRIGGEVLELTLTMRELTNDWIPAHGFDNVALSLFFDIASQDGKVILPLINSNMPAGWDWNLGHVVYGWGNSTFSSKGADAEHQGEKYGVAPEALVDKAAKTITFRYRASDFAIDTWLNAKIYITTWDITGEGAYRELAPVPGDWHFGGGETNSAKILDFMAIELTGP